MENIQKFTQRHEKNGSVVSVNMPYLRYLIWRDRPMEPETVLAFQEIIIIIIIKSLFQEDDIFSKQY